MTDIWIIAAIIAMALVFDFVNGFHDAANSIATVVSTRVLSPQKAVIWAAFFNFFAFLAFGLHVATTIGKGVLDPSSVTIPVIAAALVGTIAWDLITWYSGIPASSSHALVGGLVGAGVAHAGFGVLVIGGIILVVLIASGLQDINKEEVPLWVVLSCNAAMGLGTLAGGWRIVKTMGHRICDLQPVHGFAAEASSALCLYGATWLGIPVSTTHTITGSIMGVGATKGKYAVRWDVGSRIVWAWILTIPSSAVIAAGSWYALNLLGWR